MVRSEYTPGSEGMDFFTLFRENEDGTYSTFSKHVPRRIVQDLGEQEVWKIIEKEAEELGNEV